MKLSVGLMHDLKFKSRDLHFGEINKSNGLCGIHAKAKEKRMRGTIQGAPTCMG